jgi:hypothetical protein
MYLIDSAEDLSRSNVAGSDVPCGRHPKFPAPQTRVPKANIFEVFLDPKPTFEASKHALFRVIITILRAMLIWVTVLVAGDWVGPDTFSRDSSTTSKARLNFISFSLPSDRINRYS